jgi:hypothetical protein
LSALVELLVFVTAVAVAVVDFLQDPLLLVQEIILFMLLTQQHQL